MARASAKRKNRFLWRIIVLIVLAVIMAVSFIWSEQINYTLGLSKVDESAYSGASTRDVLELAAESDSSLKVHFVDVGQGDACVIELPDGKTMLIDGGKDKEKTALLQYIDDVIDPTDEMLNRKKNGGYGFDYAILTHADEDHCGGIDDVLSLYGARVFFRPNELASHKGYQDPGKTALNEPYSSQPTLAYRRALEEGYKSEMVFISGDPDDERASLIASEASGESSDYYEFVFYSPTKSYYKDRNDYSPIIILTFQGKRFAFSGDAEKEAEATFVENAKAGSGKYSVFKSEFSVDVIKLGHHGSRTSTSIGYLEAITAPEHTQNILAVISCGFGNSYGHPHSDAVSRLKEINISDGHILRTDANGTIVLAVQGGELMYGANVVRVLRPTVQIIPDALYLQWRELCVTVWILIAVVLLVQPFVKKNRTKIKKATGVDIGKYVPDNSKSIEKVNLTIDTIRKNKGSDNKTQASDILGKIASVAATVDKKPTSKKTTGSSKKTAGSTANKTRKTASSPAKKTTATTAKKTTATKDANSASSKTGKK